MYPWATRARSTFATLSTSSARLDGLLFQPRPPPHSHLMGGTFFEYSHKCYQRLLKLELERLQESQVPPLPIQAPAASKLAYYDKQIPEGHAIEIPPSTLPAEANITFSSSTYFKTHATLPTPDEVRAAAGERKGAGRPNSPLPLPSRRLLVKWGPDVDLNEARSQWAVWHHFRGAVPVPEVYGWCVDDEDTFIFMELVDGELVGDVWGKFDEVAKVAFCDQLRQILATITRATQGTEGPFIGTLSRGYVKDENWDSFAPCRRRPPFLPPGPFESIEQFHDYFVYPDARQQNQKPRTEYRQSLRSKLPDSVPIVFTQNDLHPYNIIVQGHRIVSLLDWQYSGWFPAYWEASHLSHYGGSFGAWRTEVYASVMEPWDKEVTDTHSEISSLNGPC